MEKFVWVVCYIDVSKITNLEFRDSKKHKKYKDIEVYIPTIKVLSKTFKKRDEYKDVPLLFNYGFFRVPEYFIYNEEFLRALKNDVPMVFQWVRDPAKERLKAIKGKKIPTVALARDVEIRELIGVSENLTTYSKTQVNELKVGQIIILKTYPFENTLVRLLGIDLARKQVQVELISDISIAPKITVSFDHVFYTIYNENSLVTAPREQSLDEMYEKGYLIEHNDDGD